MHTVILCNPSLMYIHTPHPCVQYANSHTSFLSRRFLVQYVGDIGDFQTAQDLDSLLSSHPVEVPVSDPYEINSQFDDIPYDKVCFY